MNFEGQRLAPVSLFFLSQLCLDPREDAHINFEG
jgi:hypothetical protein